MISPTFYPICAPLLSQGEINTISIMNNGFEGEGLLTLEELIEMGKTFPDNSMPNISPDDTAAIMFTSGTTSQSKPVMLSHRNLLHNASNSLAAVDIKKHTFSSLPFYHSYGLTCAILNGLVNGSKITINGDIKTMMRDLVLSNPETFMAVPLMAEALYHMLWAGIEKSGNSDRVKAIMKRRIKLKKIGLEFPDNALISIKESILGRLKLVIAGGAHLDPELCHNLKAFGILVVEGYGITECSPLIAVNRNKFFSFGSVGPVLPGCTVKIVNDEIWVKGPNTMKGYYKNPEATAEVFEGEWFKTGDLGTIDRNGFLTITGRIKNLIVLKNGKKISPEKIEELILKIPLVKDVMVYGVNSGNTADDVRPAASIHPNPELTQGMTSYEILELLQKEINKINITLPPYQQIQMVNIREKEFAKTSTKKIKRYAVH
jgi:Long-chain acyl-CoA synthetases (AMP-forming)